MIKYPISSYNKHICLKANALMTIICIYLLKPFIVTAASLLYRGKESPLDVIYQSKLFISLEAAAAIPVLILLYAWSKRAPDATDTIKLICKNGKTLIMVTAALQLCITLSPTLLSNHEEVSIIGWIQISLYILILIVTAVSTYMKDCFADFPEPKHDDQ